MSKFSTRRRVHLARLLACTAAGAGLFAASGTAFAADDDDVIIVTAQKREQNIQDVPVAVTALAGDALVANRVVNVTDLTGLAPGVMSRANAGALGSPNIAMRGVSASASVPSQDREVSMYLDGVYLGGNRGSIFDLPDIQRIEVLRGPQGTLFGRNSTAGAISIVTRDPKGEFGLTQSATFGNLSQLRTRTTVDTPQFGPFSAFVTFVHDQMRGWTRNLGAGTQFDRTDPFLNFGRTTSPKWLGGKNTESVFAALKFEPSDNFSMTYKFDWSDGHGTPEVRAVATINPLSSAGPLLLGLLATQTPGGGSFGPTGINPTNRRPKEFNNAWSMQTFSKTQGHNLTAVWQATDDITVENIFAYRRAQVYGPTTIAGLDGLEVSPITVAAFQFQSFMTGAYFSVYGGNNYGRSHQYSDEVQANYSGDSLDLTAGAIWYHSYESFGLPGYNGNIGFKFILPPFYVPMGDVQFSDSTTTSIAGYLQAEYRITPELSIVAGGRVTQDKKHGDLETGGAFVGSADRTSGAIVGTVHNPFTFKKTKFTYSFGVNYKPSDDVLVYAKYSTGYLSGGAVGEVTFAPETVKSAELGVKSEWLDHKLRVNLTGWYAKYQHLQAAQSGSIIGSPISVVVIDNGPLKTYGMELELVAKPVDGLTFSGNLGYTHKELLAPNSYFIDHLQNYKYGGVPTWTGNVSAQYETQPIAGTATFLARLDANFQGKYRGIADANVGVPTAPTYIAAFAPFEFVPSQWTVNGRVALRNIEIGGGNAEVGVWARNLFNNDKPLFPFQFGDILLTSSYAQPRTFGLDVVVRFGSHQ